MCLSAAIRGSRRGKGEEEREQERGRWVYSANLCVGSTGFRIPSVGGLRVNAF